MKTTIANKPSLTRFSISGSAAYRISGGANGALVLGYFMGLILLIAGILLVAFPPAIIVGAALIGLGAHLMLITGALMAKDYTAEDWKCVGDLWAVVFQLFAAASSTPSSVGSIGKLLVLVMSFKSAHKSCSQVE